MSINPANNLYYFSPKASRSKIYHACIRTQAFNCTSIAAKVTILAYPLLVGICLLLDHFFPLKKFPQFAQILLNSEVNFLPCKNYDQILAKKLSAHKIIF